MNKLDTFYIKQPILSTYKICISSLPPMKSPEASDKISICPFVLFGITRDHRNKTNRHKSLFGDLTLGVFCDKQ